MVHIDKGGNKKFTKYFYDKINSYGIRYDVIRQSYYPWWHGTLLDLRACLILLQMSTKKTLCL